MPSTSCFLDGHLYIPLGSVYANIFPFLIGLFAFLLTYYRSQLYILDTSPLLDMYFANSLSQSFDLATDFFSIF